MKKKLITILCIVIWCISMLSTTAFADDVDSVVVLNNVSDITLMIEYDSNARSSIKCNSPILSSSFQRVDGESIGLLSFSAKTYRDLSLEDREDYMEYMLKSISQSSGLSTRSKNKCYNFIADQDTAITSTLKYLQVDTKTDIYTAGYYLKPFNGVIGKILGFITVAVFIMLTFSIMIDVGYLTLPGVQASLQAVTKGNNEKPVLVTFAAHKALIESETDRQDEQVLWIYMRKRVPQIFIMAMCIMYLMSGMFYNIIIFVIDAVSRAYN